MAEQIGTYPGARAPARARERTRSDPTWQAYKLLHVAFVIAPTLAGLDKFYNVLVTWDQYLAPRIAGILPVTTRSFMMIVGVIEMVAGLLVAVRPRVGGAVVGVWLLGIVANLLLAGAWFDIALRDVGLAIGAFALARLASVHQRPGKVI
jgi:hypothetical protein